MSGHYQVGVFGPLIGTYESHLKRRLSERAKDLGLSRNDAFGILKGSAILKRDLSKPLVAVYFGGPSPTALDAQIARQLVDDGVWVIPFVPTTANYLGQVPTALHPLNGMPHDPADVSLSALAGRVYQGLDLLRSRRFAFISYRRAHSSKVAVQLHRSLDERCWQSFLDTHSVDAASPVQAVLWDRMNDADILIFLDTHGALDSEWVAKEIEQANQLGMGVLQLVWPNKERDRRTVFAEPIYLKPKDFVRYTDVTNHASSELKEPALRRILAAVEDLRARSINSRRLRLINAFTQYARTAGLSPVARGPNELLVVGRRPTRRYRVYPVVGHVDSAIAHRRHSDASPDKAVLLYDPSGLLKERVDHIDWLRQHLPVQHLAAQDVRAWAESA